MEQVNHKRPHRAIVRCKAKMHLLQTDFNSFEEAELLDDVLLKDLAATLFQSSRYEVLCKQCQTSQDVNIVEKQLVNELVRTYRQISKRQWEPIIQRLNALL
jgi:UDP-galactopyranose mutase